MNELLTVRDLAQYLKLNPVTILRKARTGEIPAMRVGKNFRFDKSQVDKWLRHKTVGRSVHILVIDDEPVIGQFIKDGVARKGYKVTTATSSLEALDLLAKEQFDLIFLDLVMPELAGSEVFKRIREIDERVPVAIITGHPDSDQMKKVMEQGPFLVLQKPLHLDDILKTIHSYAQQGS